MPRKKVIKGGKPQRHLSVRAVRRAEPDVRRLGRALIQYALEQAAAEAAAEQEARTRKDAS